MIYHRRTRTIKGSTDTTPITSTLGASTLAFNLQTTDKFYVGFRKKFKTRYVQIGTANDTASVLSVKYWDGDSYEDVEDLIDLTSSSGKTMAQSGFVSWQNLSDWATTKDPTESGSDTEDVDLYWTKWTVSVNLDAGTTVQALANLFVDDEILRSYYPELITDTGYLPSGRTDFVEQYDAATKLIDLRLQQKGSIRDISEVIEPSEVSPAAAHAAAYVILNGIPNKGEELINSMNTAKDAMDYELSKATISLDYDNSGAVSESERDVAPIYVPRS